MERFDPLEYRAARTMGEADFFFKNQSRIHAARIEIAEGIFQKIRKLLDAALLRRRGLQ